MPRGDGTGPQGKGPRTGRGLGRCLPETAGAFKDRRSGLTGNITDMGPGLARQSAGRERGIGSVILDLLFLWFERISRK